MFGMYLEFYTGNSKSALESGVLQHRMGIKEDVAIDLLLEVERRGGEWR